MTGSPAGRPSGLRDPGRAVRSVAAAALALEGLSVLFSLAPIAKVAGGLTGGALAALLCLSIALFSTAALLRHGWAYIAGSILQLGVLAAGFIFGAMFVLGAAFGLVWIYVLRLRRTVGSAGPRPKE